MTNRRANLNPYFSGAASILDLSGYTGWFMDLLSERTAGSRIGRGLASDFERVGEDLEQALLHAIKTLDLEQRAALTRALQRQLQQTDSGAEWIQRPTVQPHDQLELGFQPGVEAADCASPDVK